MKKIYVLASAFLMSTGAFAQTGGHELFFSEYAEGAHASGSTPPGGGATSAGVERAIEVFNPTTATVDLGKYSIARYSNGATTPFQEERLQRNVGTPVPPNTLSSSSVFVYANEAATLTDITNKWNQKASAYGPVTNSTVITQGGAAYFDGNDAMVLRRWTGAQAGQGTGIIVDILGVIGENPARGRWRSHGVDANGNPYDVRTANQCIVRKPHIENGITVNPVAATYQLADQWETFSAWDSTQANPTGWYAQSYANLGIHDFQGTLGTYNVTGILEEFNNAISIYPNPTVNKTVTIDVTDAKVSSVVILNMMGQTAMNKVVKLDGNKAIVDVASLAPGLYFVQFVNADNTVKIYKELIVK